MSISFIKQNEQAFIARRDSQSEPALRVVALAAPDRVEGRKDPRAIDSSDPASLFNACRIAALRSTSDDGAWSNSNWAGGRTSIRKNFLLMYSQDEIQKFIEVLKRENPNVLLIGAMTLCMPGAIECAKIARRMYGQNILIVLGGRHPTETVYLSNPRNRSSRDVSHHQASPTVLIRSGKVPPVFDIIVSGEAEHVIAELGEIVSSSDRAIDAATIMKTISTTVPGDWILSAPDVEDDIVSVGVPIDRNALPPLAPLFGVSTAFDVFDGRKTAHVFSDTGPGCVYDCAFCSERSSVTGGLSDVSKAPHRLYRQLAEAAKVISEDHPGYGASAFVEDSVLLGGSPRMINLFCDLLEEVPLDIIFGAQLTIDQIIGRESQVARLSKLGLRYLFIGLETFDPQEIGGMSKDLGSKSGSWHSRFHTVLDILERNEILCGCALLFGLGEPHGSRIALLDTVIAERRKRGSPVTVSANWAVQHPLRDQVPDAGYEFIEWGTPPGRLLDLFHNFGEASMRYCLPNVAPPTVDEVEEIVMKLNELSGSHRELIGSVATGNVTLFETRP